MAASGVNVLAAYVPKEEKSYESFAFDSGTSMACPIVSGIVALLKVLHPSWSPPAIRSALATTGMITNSEINIIKLGLFILLPLNVGVNLTSI